MPFCSDMSPSLLKTTLPQLESTASPARGQKPKKGSAVWRSPCCWRRLDLVGELAVLSGVEPEALLGLADPQADRGVEHLEDHEGQRHREDDRRDDRERLDAELSGVAVEQPVAAGVVDGLGREQSGRQGAPDAADAV